MSSLALISVQPATFPVAVLRAEDPHPTWRQKLTAMVLDGLSSPHSRVAYKNALDDFFTWWEPRRADLGPFSKSVVAAWKASLEARGLAPASVNQRLSAVRKLATEAVDNGMCKPEVAAAIGRVKGAARHGVRSGNWLTRDQAQKVLNSPDPEDQRGKRDRALLALLFGCGLRRAEAAALNVAHIQQREGRWVIVDLIGKHGRIRTVPMPAWVKVALDRWTEAAGITEGRVLRAVNKSDRVWGAGLTPKVVRTIVMQHAGGIAPRFSAHDARRTFAKLCRTTGGDLEQIQLLLGHASIQTTERYLGTKLNLEEAANDGLRLRA